MSDERIITEGGRVVGFGAIVTYDEGEWMDGWNSDCAFNDWFNEMWRDVFGVPTPPSLIDLKNRLWLRLHNHPAPSAGQARDE